MNYVISLPSIYQPYTDDCLASMSESVRSHVLVQNNTINNIGVTPSWNLGLQHMYDTNADWLILLSAAIRFKQGGDDLIAQLEAHKDDLDVVESLGVFGWHLIAFNRRVFDKIGSFDENLTNYFSDLDWSLRIQKAYAPANAPWEKVEVALEDMGMAHGIKFGGAKAIEPADPKILYFVTKWGRHPGAWRLGSYDTPFDEADKDLKFWPNQNFIGGNL